MPRDVICLFRKIDVLKKSICYNEFVRSKGDQQMCQYHLSYFEPFKNEYVNWPDGGWSVYAINGDQIADRIIREKINSESLCYEGKVIARRSWCGYLGTGRSLQEAMTLIENHKAKKRKE
jgi:hypothetical protein